MTDAPDLLPCPFCGGDAVEFRANDVGCSNEECWCFHKTRHVKAAEWNTRDHPMTVAEAAKVLLGDEYFSPMIAKLDGFNNDADVANDVLGCLRALSQGGE